MCTWLSDRKKMAARKQGVIAPSHHINNNYPTFRRKCLSKPFSVWGEGHSWLPSPLWASCLPREGRNTRATVLRGTSLDADSKRWRFIIILWNISPTSRINITAKKSQYINTLGRKCCKMQALWRVQSIGRVQSQEQRRNWSSGTYGYREHSTQLSF